MNQQSSRSHAIFTIIVEQRLLSDENQSGAGSDYITAKFHLVSYSQNSFSGSLDGITFAQMFLTCRAIIHCCTYPPNSHPTCIPGQTIASFFLQTSSSYM